MKRTKGFWRNNAKLVTISLIVAVGLAYLMLYKLGSLVIGMSADEIKAASAPVGLHGVFNNLLQLPMQIVRSIVFVIAPDHGQTLSRLPNTIFGSLAILSFGLLIWLWHGARTAILSTLLFATSAWTLHVSRYVSFDVVYLWAIPTLLLIQVFLHRYGEKSYVWYGSLALWGMMLYVPGLIWLMLIQLYCQRGLIIKTARNFNSLTQRIMSMLVILIWIPLLILELLRDGQFTAWLGLPAQFPSLMHLGKQIVAVPVHLFIRGPQYPGLWLDKLPILDIFTLVMCLLGIYFYARNYKATRSQTLLLLFVGGVILVGLGGAVSISALVSLLYIFAAAGIAYLLHEWLKVFPLNPLARGVGIGLVSLAVLLSCLYGLRSYFIAWPHNYATRITFRYHR